MNKILNNDYFRELLQEADEEFLVCTSIHYLPYHVKEQSLVNNEEYFHQLYLLIRPKYYLCRTVLV